MLIEAHGRASMAQNKKTRAGSALLASAPDIDEEFFTPSENKGATTTTGHPRPKRNSLAVIAQQQVLMSHPFGSLAFTDTEAETAWQRCYSPAAALRACPAAL